MTSEQAKELITQVEMELSNVRQCPNEANIVDAFKVVEKALVALLDDFYWRHK